MISTMPPPQKKNIVFSPPPSPSPPSPARIFHAVLNQAWEDLYTFVILIVIPRTALRLEESIRSAGPVSTMLRSTPISGTRLKAHTTPPRNWHPRGDVGSPHMVIGTPHTVAGTPHTVDGEWFGAGARRIDGGARMPIVRSGSGSFTRSIGVRGRNGSHKGGGGGRSSGKHLSDAEPHGGSAGAGRLRGGHHNATFPGQYRAHDDGYTPGGSPSSVASSMASGLQLSVTGSVATTTGYDSVCASPDGSAVSSGARQRGDGRRSKILRGLGKLGVGTGGAGTSGGGGTANSSPKGSIRSRARAAFGRTRQDGGVEDNGSDVGGKELSSSAGAAAPHVPSAVRRGHSRGSSVRPEVVSAAAAAAPIAPGGGSDPSANAATLVTQAVDGANGVNGSSSGSKGGGENGWTSSARSTRGSRGNGDHGRRRGRSDGAPATLPSPARSVVSLPGGRSWDQPSQRGSTGSLSRRLNSRTVVAPTSESPSAVFLAPPDFEWGDAAEADRSRLRRQAGRGEKGAGGVRGRGVDSSASRVRGGGAGGAGGVNGIDRRSLNTRPDDQARGPERPVRRSAPAGLVESGARDTTAAGTASRTTAPHVDQLQQQQVEAGVAAVDPLQLPASSRARMESVSFNRNGVFGVGKATAGSRRRSDQLSGTGGGSERKLGVREKDNSEHGSAPRALSVSGRGGLIDRKDDASLMEPLEPLVLPVTPGVDDAQYGRAKLASPSPTALHSGSRRTGKRASAAAR